MAKYTIETDGNTADDIGGYLGIPIEICKKRTWVKTDMELTPYTEPDTESIRKEAYEQGINDAREGKASCEFCEYEMCSDRADPCRICACNYMNLFKPKKQEEMDGLRQNIQTIVDQCGYTLDEIAAVLQKMREF